jgi:DNA mismatch repair protein MutS2
MNLVPVLIPNLGALAEIFLEEFYHREAFGIITTHHSNSKNFSKRIAFCY